jgi:hypothetical protein
VDSSSISYSPALHLYAFLYLHFDLLDFGCEL